MELFDGRPNNTLGMLDTKNFPENAWKALSRRADALRVVGRKRECAWTWPVNRVEIYFFCRLKSSKVSLFNSGGHFVFCAKAKGGPPKGRLIEYFKEKRGKPAFIVMHISHVHILFLGALISLPARQEQQHQANKK